MLQTDLLHEQNANCLGLDSIVFCHVFFFYKNTNYASKVN